MPLHPKLSVAIHRKTEHPTAVPQRLQISHFRKSMRPDVVVAVVGVGVVVGVDVVVTDGVTIVATVDAGGVVVISFTGVGMLSAVVIDDCEAAVGTWSFDGDDGRRGRIGIVSCRLVSRWSMRC